MILCEAENLPQSGSLKWTSNATTRWESGPQWDFALGESSIPAITLVSLEICQESDCQVVSTTVDTSALVPSVVTDSGTPSTTTSAPSTTTSAPSTTTVLVPDPPLLQRLPIGPLGPYDPTSNTSGVLSLNADRLLNGQAATFPGLSEYGRPLNETKLSWAIGFHVPGDTLVYVPLDSTVENFSWHDSGGQIQSWDDWSIRLKPISDQRPPAPEGHAPDSFTWLVEIDHLVSLNCPRPRVWPDRCDRLPIINGVELHRGMILEEGQVLGYVGHLADYADTGLNGHVEMQINYTTDDWRLTKSYCPFDFLTGTARATIESEWNDFMAVYETWAGDSGVYDEEKMITPGCRYLRADHLNDGSEFGLNTPFVEPE